MKCIRCKKDAKKKDRDANGGCCPSCRHPFVTNPASDRFTDMAIKSAEDIVSANGLFYFSKAQLKYQLQRKLKKKQRAIKIASIIAFIMVIAFIKFAYPVVAFITGFLLLVFIGQWSSLAKAMGALDALLTKWIGINPHQKLLVSARFQSDQSANTGHLEDISFERVLICDRNDTVDFFLANLFHFHYSCPVLGGNNYPPGICEDMRQRLKRNPNLQVFLLHDYSPAGRAFAQKMKTDLNWFGGQGFNIIDLGLNKPQKKLFKAMTTTIRDQEVAEVTLFQPGALVSMTGAAINEGVPLDQISSMLAANHNDGYG